MIDIKEIRQQPELYREAAKRKRIDLDLDLLLELDNRCRALQAEVDELRRQRNQLSEATKAIAEEERALALDPTTVNAYEGLGQAHLGLGEFERSFEFFDKAIRLSQHDPTLPNWYRGKASAHFALKQYDQAIEWSHRTITVNPGDQFAHKILIASLALGGEETEANEALQRYLALPPAGLDTIAAWKAFNAHAVNERTDPRYLEYLDRQIEGLRKAGMPEG